MAAARNSRRRQRSAVQCVVETLTTTTTTNRKPFYTNKYRVGRYKTANIFFPDQLPQPKHFVAYHHET